MGCFGRPDMMREDKHTKLIDDGGMDTIVNGVRQHIKGARKTTEEELY